jgi:hypothetical protein
MRSRVRRAKGVRAFESNESPATDAEAVQLMEELTKALKHLEADEHVAGVLVSPNDQFTAVLQSYLAEHSLEAGKVEPWAAAGSKRSSTNTTSSVGPEPVHLDQEAKTAQVARPRRRPRSAPNTLRVGILGDWDGSVRGPGVCREYSERPERLRPAPAPRGRVLLGH